MSAITPPPDANRPRPVRRAFATVGAAVIAVGTAANAAVTVGAAELAAGTSFAEHVVWLPAGVQLAVVAAAITAVITRIEAVTTPTADPAVVVNNRLVALVRDPDQLRAALRGDR